MYGFTREENPTTAANIWTSDVMMEKFKKYGAASVITNAADQNREIARQKILVPFTYLSTFFRFLEIPLINSEIELPLTWSKKCVLGYSHDDDARLNQNATATGEGVNDIKVDFQIMDTKTYILVVTLRSIEGEKLLRNLERGFHKTINWNKLTLRETTLRGIQFDVMIEPIFQGVNKLFI